MRLFLDANVLFSAAHNPRGRAKNLFVLAQEGSCVLLTSPHAVTEARRNIQLKYPAKSLALEALIRELSVEVEATSENVAWALEQGLVLKDVPILAAAVQAQAALLVTGDRTHFGHLYGKIVRGVEVITLAEALARVLS